MILFAFNKANKNYVESGEEEQKLQEENATRVSIIIPRSCFSEFCMLFPVGFYKSFCQAIDQGKTYN